MFVKVSAEHSIRILECLAREDGRRHSAQELSRCLDIPLPFFMKIVSQLKRGKLVKTIQGRSGGFLLAKKPEKITVFDVLKATENDCLVAPCLASKQKTKIKKEIRDYFEVVQASMTDHLKSTTIKDLVSAE